jgi:metal-responsive CopG/Arc/MetJ family transcriptional regulator
MSQSKLDTPVVARMPEDLIDQIDAYWHEKKLKSRSIAIRELLAYALDRKLADLKQELGLTKPAKEKAR